MTELMKVSAMDSATQHLVIEVCADLKEKFSAVDVSRRFNEKFSNTCEKMDRFVASDILESFVRRSFVRYDGINRDGFALYAFVPEA